MDNELFELCKEVYERTGWFDKDEPRSYVMSPLGEWGILNIQRGKTVRAWNPLYTSDYLLEKLPRYVSVTKTGTYTIGKETETTYRAESNQTGNECIYADTPLKALLKLTIALHEAKELV